MIPASQLNEEITGRLAKNLRTVRQGRGLTQVELAERARIHDSVVSLLENAHRPNVSLSVVNRLAHALGLDITALLEPIR